MQNVTSNKVIQSGVVLRQSVRLPAEWERQSALMLTWPHPDTDWYPILHEVEPVFVEISLHAGQRQRVIIVCHDEAQSRHVGELLGAQGISPDKYTLYIAPSNDSWARDHGPISVLRDHQPQLLDFTFNGWGEKFSADLDNRITSRLHQAGAFGDTPLQTIDFVLEGGSIETDGQGTLLTTTSCLLSPRRNPGLAKTDIEKRLRQYLNVQRILWLEHGHLQGDDTDGHIDTLARFANPETILYVASTDPADPNHASLQRMAEELKRLAQPNGDPYHLVPLPAPVIRDDAGHCLPASYANFLIINDAVLVPLYGMAMDNPALEIFGKSFVRRKIIGINCRPLIQQYGSLHCVTMQLPAGIVP
jgi:agmatine/peptidylarginine deiminase